MRLFSSVDWWPTARERLLQAGSLRTVRATGLLTGLVAVAGVVQLLHPFPSALLAASVDDQVLRSYERPAVVGVAPLHLREATYQVWAEPSSAVVTLASPTGRIYTSLPLCALAGRASLPEGTVAHTSIEDGALHTRMLAADGTPLSDAVLRPGAHWFTVSFSARVGQSTRLAPGFFSDGQRGMGLSTIEAGYTPDVRGPSSTPLPQVSTVGRTPFAPAPFDIQLRGDPGWFGVGVVQVPSATTMRLQRDGTVSLDYALDQAGPQPDFGAGTPLAGLARFPDFVVTFADSPDQGLRAYHDALQALQVVTVASPPGKRPEWWSRPMVDTWGEQMATHAQRGSAAFGADWVRRFVADWKARYHLQHFTVVIDSRWQQRIGDPLPDVVRFGGMAGMRKLVDELHAQGLHVLLWWPMWAHRIDVIPVSAKQARLLQPAHIIDPTVPEFQTDMAATMQSLLGTGPDDLAADGLKLDWQYDIPLGLARPEQASGALALYRYMDVVHTLAHALRHDAMIDASSAAPQFEAVADTVRLYDAWNQAEWDRRAAIVAAATPEMLVDGDGWQADPNDIVAHTVSSSVYGTPAMYFDRTFMGGRAIPADLSADLGAVMSLSSLKGEGYAVPLAGGEWQYDVGGQVTAQTFAHDHALVVRAAGCTPTWQAQVVSTVGGRLLVPMTGRQLVGAVDGLERRATAIPVAHGVLLTVRPGTTYTLTFRGGC